MTQLTEHFKLSEFIRSDKARELGNDNMPDTPEILANLTQLARALEWVRELFDGAPVLISSGYRNRIVNKAVGGVPDSDHALGFAADFMVKGFTKEQIVERIRYSSIAYDQLIDEPTWVHLSINPRWRRENLIARRSGPGGKMVYRPMP